MEPEAGDLEAAVILGSDQARATAAVRLEQRAAQHLDDPLPEDVLSGKSTGGAAFRKVFRPFLLSPRVVAITKQRILEDPAFHIRMIDKNIPTPQATRSDDGNAKAVVLVLGAGGMNLQYGAVPEIDGEPSIEVRAERSIHAETEVHEERPEIREGDGSFGEQERP